MSEQKLKIAYSGIEGAFANIAAKKIFPSGEFIAYKDFKSAWNAVNSSMADYAVLPIENSYAGEIAQVTDLIFTGNLFINDVYGLKIQQNLLGIKGAKLQDIKKVISHPQALEQSAKFLESHGIETVASENTARAAREVSVLNDKSVGAVASILTAELYNLDVIQKDINESKDNTTRFAVISKKEGSLYNKKHSTVIMMFTVKNEAGSLIKALNVISAHGFNMDVLRSRPLKGLAWQYYFYVEIEGNSSSTEFFKMLESLRQKCESIKIVGSYNKNE